MTDSNFVFEAGKTIRVGTHGDHDYVFHSGEPVTDLGASEVVFESGTGLGGGALIEDFEDGDLSEYVREDTGGGALNRVETQQTTVIQGEYSLIMEGSNGTSDITSYSGLPNYPQRGDSFEAKFRIYNDVSSARFYFFASGTDGRPDTAYYVQVSEQNSDAEIARLDSSSFTDLDNTSFTPTDGATYRWRIDTESGGQITATLFDSSDSELLQLTADDSTFDSGGIGFAHSTDNQQGRSYWDAVQLL